MHLGDDVHTRARVQRRRCSGACVCVCAHTAVGALLWCRTPRLPLRGHTATAQRPCALPTRTVVLSGGVTVMHLNTFRSREPSDGCPGSFPPSRPLRCLWSAGAAGFPAHPRRGCLLGGARRAGAQPAMPAPRRPGCSEKAGGVQLWRNKLLKRLETCKRPRLSQAARSSWKLAPGARERVLESCAGEPS